MKAWKKIIHTLHTPKAKDAEQAREQLIHTEMDLHQFENEKVKGAIRTDFILSAEDYCDYLGNSRRRLRC